MCQSLFFNKVVGLQNTSGWLLLGLFKIFLMFIRELVLYVFLQTEISTLMFVDCLSNYVIDVYWCSWVVLWIVSKFKVIRIVWCFCLCENPMYLYCPFWITGVRMNWFTAQFSNFRQNPVANKKERNWYMSWLKTKMPKLQLNGQSAFYARRTRQKLSFHLRNYVQSSRTGQVLQQLMKFHLIFYGLNWSRKKTILNQPSKTTTLNIIIVAQQTIAPICLHECKTYAGKFKRMIKITTH